QAAARAALALVREDAHDDRREDRQQLAEVDASGRLLALVELLGDLALALAEDVRDDLLAVGLVDVVDRRGAGEAAVPVQRLLDGGRALAALSILRQTAEQRRAALMHRLPRHLGADAEALRDVIDRHLLQDLIDVHVFPPRRTDAPLHRSQ